MDEASLIAAAQQGRVDAFNDLVLAYQQQVYNLAYRILIARFRGGSFKSYLMRIVANGCYDELRRRKRRPVTSFEDFGAVDEEANPALINRNEGPEKYVERQEMAHVIQAGIETLPPDQRITLVLSDVQGLSYQEIAEATDVPLGTVRSARCARAWRGRGANCAITSAHTGNFCPRGIVLSKEGCRKQKARDKRQERVADLEFVGSGE